MKFLFSLLLLCVSAQAGTFSNAQYQVNVWLTNLWPTVVSKQATYYQNHDRYWQGLLSFQSITNIPNWTTTVDGSAISDNLTVTPYYQAESVADILTNLTSSTVPAAFTCDQYKGPNGDGFIVTVFVRWNGTNFYSRAQNYGPETWRTYYWQKFDPFNQGI